MDEILWQHTPVAIYIDWIVDKPHTPGQGAILILQQHFFAQVITCVMLIVS